MTDHIPAILRNLASDLTQLETVMIPLLARNDANSDKLLELQDLDRIIQSLVAIAAHLDWSATPNQDAHAHFQAFPIRTLARQLMPDIAGQSDNTAASIELF
ncbi:hypothetical protein [Pseudoprimorskyibacter insulae]|uniref:Uncharacterized protein n=1 Tax=Pseudoprimorskyibacter insulae TaxID=1695997 RepID=A0A2R8B196_9RHOB|nr:hypothetical protein [Pseudoprimorskyibacter insulae]SPF81944.1 hypothetical protein PRI8871_03771 [Pseudoprimorskyibacter insulae]